MLVDVSNVVSIFVEDVVSSHFDLAYYGYFIKED